MFKSDNLLGSWMCRTRILRDGDLLVSRRFEQEWQTLQWAEQEQLFIEQGGD
jgi:hypothetical protein